MVVDQQIHILGHAMTGEVDLADRRNRQCIEIGDRVEPEIPRADIKVVDVAQNPAAGSPGDFRDELRLGDRRMAIAQVGGRVLDQQPPPEHLLCLLDMTAEEIEALFGIGQRQQIVQVSTADRAPRQMLRDQRRLNPFDQHLEPL